jgi:hypothetical protein
MRRPPNPPRYRPLVSKRAAVSSRLTDKAAIVWPSRLGTCVQKPVRSSSLPRNLRDSKLASSGHGGLRMKFFGHRNCQRLHPV